jgi:hypothetical protein
VLGLGWAQWLTIIALIGGLILTFKVMARASISYEKARRAREEAEEDRRGESAPRKDEE